MSALHRCREGIPVLLFVAFSAPGLTQTPPQFDAATVKPAGPSERFYPRLDITAGRLTARAATLRYLIMEAYGVDNYQVTGAANWIDKDLFTIAATFPSGASREETMAMLRTLLADRFQLKTHQETRAVKVFDLTVAKGGSKLEPLQDGESPRVPAGLSGDQMSILAGTTAAEFVKFLNARTGAAALGWPVVDHTNLTGRFQFRLILNLKTNPDGVSGTADIDYQSALPAQLGLRLEPAREDCTFVVIDSVSKPGAP